LVIVAEFLIIIVGWTIKQESGLKVKEERIQYIGRQWTRSISFLTIMFENPLSLEVWWGGSQVKKRGSQIANCQELPDSFGLALWADLAEFL
jgi:hypothetical protein